MTKIIKMPADADNKAKNIFYIKLGLLYFLNLADWICTEALLASGRFAEANPVMQPVLQNFWLTLLVKGALPLALVLGCAFIYKITGAEYSRPVNFLLNLGLSAYVLVDLWHIFNFALLFLGMV